jgi:hypothetical protein
MFIKINIWYTRKPVLTMLKLGKPILTVLRFGNNICIKLQNYKKLAEPYEASKLLYPKK